MATWCVACPQAGRRNVLSPAASHPQLDARQAYAFGSSWRRQPPGLRQTGAAGQGRDGGTGAQHVPRDGGCRLWSSWKLAFRCRRARRRQSYPQTFIELYESLRVTSAARGTPRTLEVRRQAHRYSRPWPAHGRQACHMPAGGRAGRRDRGRSTCRETVAAAAIPANNHRAL